MRALLLLFAAAVANAVASPVTYTIDVSPTGTANLLAFSTTFTARDFITSPTIPAFAPFSLTDGTNFYPMTQALVGQFPGTGCFILGNTAATVSSCVVQGPGAAGGVALLLPTDLPTSYGVYAFSFVGGFVPGGATILGSGTMTLSAPAPEPASLGLMIASLAILGWRNRNRVNREA